MCNTFVVAVTECGGAKIIPSSGTLNIASPNHPANYPDNLVCTWSISSATNTSIRAHFQTFTTQAPNDILSVFDGFTTATANRVMIHSGSQIPSDVEVDGQRMTIKFATDEIVSLGGFEVMLVEIGGGQGMCVFRKF